MAGKTSFLVIDNKPMETWSSNEMFLLNPSAWRQISGAPPSNALSEDEFKGQERELESTYNKTEAVSIPMGKMRRR